MKSVKFLSIALFFVLSCSVMGEDVETQLWAGGKDLVKDPEQCLFLEHNLFASAKPGDCIRIKEGNLQGTGRHAIYLGGYDIHPLPGMDDRVFNSFPIDIYLTEDMLNAISAKDVRFYGEGATITRVCLVSRDAVMKSGHVLWTGFFWMDEWTTLNLYTNPFSGINFGDYKAIRFYSEARRTDYIINVMTQFDCVDCKLGDQSSMTMTNEYAELVLTDAIRTKLSTVCSQSDGKLYIQCNKESGAAFNFTDVVLIPNDPIDPCTNCFSINIH